MAQDVAQDVARAIALIDRRAREVDAEIALLDRGARDVAINVEIARLDRQLEELDAERLALNNAERNAAVNENEDDGQDVAQVAENEHEDDGQVAQVAENVGENENEDDGQVAQVSENKHEDDGQVAQDAANLEFIERLPEVVGDDEVADADGLTWNDRYASLVAYRESNGNAEPPADHPTLGSWTYDQRESYFRSDQDMPTTLTLHRYLRLCEADFRLEFREDERRNEDD
jgi:hypothetical protein